ncbi:MAG: HEAT repeat domain-containing protein [Oscillatoriaceae bacterium SKW80]|nr:HEAT repeat domain-containing protein [Oscillatoriaceae bacterium SKYG93]MCX8122303.1 HEAT repeat domain-containing protein [Oscillatoriaceae bacterium SKW80]MDW8452518.1 HEAT repeat domain-containing protein [Oscillatoriaceae cyanobacterium SKYGB_i_bin93]
MTPIQVTAALANNQREQYPYRVAPHSPLSPRLRGSEFKQLQKHHITKLQESVGLSADKEVTTWEHLLSTRNSEEQKPPTTPQPAQSLKPGFLKGFPRVAFLLGLGVFSLIAVFGGLFYLLMRGSESQEDKQENCHLQAAVADSDNSNSTHQQNYNSMGEPRLLAKLDIVEDLIRELQTTEPAKRRRAIWELGQRGDSRAVQPLVNLMVDSDSKQRSLILAALSEIGNRTLTPINRALSVSLQDENPEVRKNAIRDLTRIYELVVQMSYLLRYAVDDPDPEVQETARWALERIGAIRNLSMSESTNQNLPQDE